MKLSLIFFSTHNESEDLERPCDELRALERSADILFCDDTSPDGTGEMIARLVNEAEATSQIGLDA
jgi:GT2 family glycosyltransferase